MIVLALLQANVSFGRSWLDYLITGTYFYGLVGSTDDAKSLGIDIDLWWDLVTLPFG